MLLVKGPNVMLGYLGQPELTAQVIRDGWYVTGDIAMIDAEGFIRITGRLSRFSKLGGEMVPHLRVEEAIAQDLDLGEEEIRIVVTAVSDPKKGERLIVLHTRLDMPPEQICRKLTEESAAVVDSLARQLHRGRSDSLAGHRQARSPGRARAGRRHQ